MTDNVTLPASGAVIASDNIGGSQFQRIKIVTGADGVLGGDVTVSNGFPVLPVPATLAVTATGAAAAGVTLTLPVVTGQFHYITELTIALYNTAARTGGATPVIVTTTNLPGSLAFTLPSAGAVGAIDRILIPLGIPLRSSAAGTATTIVAPATASVIWRLTAMYFVAA